MIETVKKSPGGRKRWIRRILSAAGAGVVFGIFAVLTIGVLLPAVLKKTGKVTGTESEAEITLGAEDLSDTADGVSEAENDVLENSQKEFSSILTSLELYETLYEDILEVSAEARKALVQVCRMSDDENLLEISLMSGDDEDGIIFLENDADLYILTTNDNFVDESNLRVTFCDDSFAEASLCGVDENTGIAVIRVSRSQLQKETEEKIAAAKLNISEEMSLANTVIAVGSPAGDPESLSGGMITSVAGTVQVTDAEYVVLATDIQGSQEGGGFLLDADGAVVGIITQIEDRNNNVLRALSIKQLSTLIEMLLNGKTVPRLGIQGSTISEQQSKELEIPRGIYVEQVEPESPAMRAGIRSGDFICMLDGTAVETMQDYTGKLQTLSTEKNTVITLYRLNSKGKYTKMDFNVKIEK